MNSTSISAQTRVVAATTEKRRFRSRLLFALAVLAASAVVGPASALAAFPSHPAPSISCQRGTVASAYSAGTPSSITVPTPSLLDGSVMPWYASSNPNYREKVAFRFDLQYYDFNLNNWVDVPMSQADRNQYEPWIWAYVNPRGSVTTGWYSINTPESLVFANPNYNYAVRNYFWNYKIAITPGFYYRVLGTFYWYASGQSTYGGPNSDYRDASDYCYVDQPFDF